MIRFVTIVVALFCLTGCEEMALFAGLGEKEANEIVAVLLENGVDCSKVPGAEGTWDLSVSKENFSYAMSILKALELPKQKFQSMSEVFPKGTFSTPNEDHYRYEDLRAQQISEAILMNFPAVMSVKVNLAIPLADPLSDKEPESKASVVLKYRPDFDFAMEEAKLKDAVASSLSGLSAEQVTVLAHPSEVVMPPPRLESDQGLRSRLDGVSPVLAAGVGLAAGAVLVALVGWIFQRRKSKTASAT